MLIISSTKINSIISINAQQSNSQLTHCRDSSASEKSNIEVSFFCSTERSIVAVRIGVRHFCEFSVTFRSASVKLGLSCNHVARIVSSRPLLRRLKITHFIIFRRTGLSFSIAPTKLRYFCGHVKEVVSLETENVYNTRVDRCKRNVVFVVKKVLSFNTKSVATVIDIILQCILLYYIILHYVT